MRKRNFLLLLLFAGGMTACIDGDKDLSLEMTPPDVPIENYKFTKDFLVPVESGNTTIVTYNGETIYEGNVATTIQVPKFSTIATRNGTGLEWHFVPENGTGNSWHYQTYREGLLLFEDIPNGDNDYNDFVCYIFEQFQVNLDGNGYIRTDPGQGLQFSRLGIYPKAMGNTIPLSFGVEIVRSDTGEYIDDVIIYNDIRKEAFENAEGFINTDPERPVIMHGNGFSNIEMMEEGKRYYPQNLRENGFAINYYIIANGKKHYTADSSKAVKTANNAPFGLFIPKSDDGWMTLYKNFKHTVENTSIFQAYPNFTGWLKNEHTTPFLNPEDKLLYGERIMW